MKSKKGTLYSIFAFVLPAALLTVVLTVNGIYPFGEKSILIYDLRSQYVDFFASLKNGGNFFYTFERAFGGDCFSLTAYYLMSPFNIIIMLPWNDIVSAITVIYYLKVMTAGLTFSIYLRRTRLFALDIRFTPLLAAVYTFCGFAVMYAQNIMWLDALWLLPLIAWTIEILVSEGRQKWFIIAIAAAMIINFYMGFIIAAFSFVYMLFLQLTIEHDGRGRTFLRYITAAFTGLSLSSVIVFTAYNKLALTKLSEDNLLYLAGKNFFNDISNIFDLLFFISLVIGVICVVFILLDKRGVAVIRVTAKPKTVFIITAISVVIFIFNCLKNSGIFISAIKKYLPFKYDLDSPQLYCSSVCVILAFMLIVFWIIDKKTKTPQYITLCLWVSLPVVCPGLDLLLHSGQIPISFPARYSFIISFVIILMAAYALSLIKLDLLRGFIPTIVTLTASVIIIFELTSNAVLAFRYNEDVYYGYYPKESYDSFISVNNDALKMIGNNARIEKTYYRYLNDSMALGYRGLTHYSSMYRRSFIAVMRSLGYAASEYWSSYFGSTPVLDSLFGIDYLLDMTDTDYASRMYIKRTGRSYASDLYDKTGSTHLIDIYRNPCSLPVAYEVDEGFTSSVIDGIDPFERQNSLVSAMTGKKETLFIVQSVPEPIYIDMNSDESQNITEGKYALYSFTVSQDGTLYMYIHSGTHTPCRIFVNDIFYANYQTSQAGIAYSVYLGSYKSGDTIKIRLEPIGTELNFTSADFYILTKNYSSVINSLHIGAAEVSSLDGNKINLKAKQSGLLFTSIPYEEGWSVMNEDGVSTAELVEASGFLCVDLNDGINNVKLVYTPPGLWRGCILSAEGLILLFCILAKEKKVK